MNDQERDRLNELVTEMLDILHQVNTEPRWKELVFAQCDAFVDDRMMFTAHDVKEALTEMHDLPDEEHAYTKYIRDNVPLWFNRADGEYVYYRNYQRTLVQLDEADKSTKTYVYHNVYTNANRYVEDYRAKREAASRTQRIVDALKELQEEEVFCLQKLKEVSGINDLKHAEVSVVVYDHFYTIITTGRTRLNVDDSLVYVNKGKHPNAGKIRGYILARELRSALEPDWKNGESSHMVQTMVFSRLVTKYRELLGSESFTSVKAALEIKDAVNIHVTQTVIWAAMTTIAQFEEGSMISTKTDGAEIMTFFPDTIPF